MSFGIWWQWLCKEIKYQLFALGRKKHLSIFTQQAQIKTCQTHFSKGSVILYFCFLDSLHCFLVILWLCRVAYRYRKRWSKEGSRTFTHKAPCSSSYTKLLNKLLIFVNMLVYFYFCWFIFKENVDHRCAKLFTYHWVNAFHIANAYFFIHLWSYLSFSDCSLLLQSP